MACHNKHDNKAVVSIVLLSLLMLALAAPATAKYSPPHRFYSHKNEINAWSPVPNTPPEDEVSVLARAVTPEPVHLDYRKPMIGLSGVIESSSSSSSGLPPLSMSMGSENPFTSPLAALMVKPEQWKQFGITPPWEKNPSQQQQQQQQQNQMMSPELLHPTLLPGSRVANSGGVANGITGNDLTNAMQVGQYRAMKNNLDGALAKNSYAMDKGHVLMMLYTMLMTRVEGGTPRQMYNAISMLLPQLWNNQVAGTML